MPSDKERLVIRKHVPHDGQFWKSSCESAYCYAFDQMVAVGMHRDDVIKLLGNLYSATADEFGG